MTGPLWHWTCEHAAELIALDGFLLPNPQPVLGGDPLVWATDLPEPWGDALGLRRSDLAPCDRLAVRLSVVDVDVFVPWTRYAHDRPVPWQLRHLLEGTAGAMPRHWFVARIPARVEPATVPA